MTVSNHRNPRSDVAPTPYFDALSGYGILQSVSPHHFVHMAAVAASALRMQDAGIAIETPSLRWLGTTDGARLWHGVDSKLIRDAILAEDHLAIDDLTALQLYRTDPLVLDGPKAQSALGVPLQLDQGSVAATLIALDPKPRTFTDQELIFAFNLAAATANALDVLLISERDPLTQVLSRHAFIRRLAQKLKSGPRTDFCIAILDLDYFKKINDKYGHIVGDNALVATANLIGEIIAPAQAAFGRLGGEEFAIILEGTMGQAKSYLSRIQAEFHGFRCAGLRRGEVTVSIGACQAMPWHAVPSDILRNADLALYEAKERGRDQLVIFKPHHLRERD